MPCFSQVSCKFLNGIRVEDDLRTLAAFLSTVECDLSVGLDGTYMPRSVSLISRQTAHVPHFRVARHSKHGAMAVDSRNNRIVACNGVLGARVWGGKYLICGEAEQAETCGGLTPSCS